MTGTDCEIFMKTPNILSWVPSLILVVTSSLEGSAQNATNLTASFGPRSSPALASNVAAPGSALSVTLNQPDIPSETKAAGSGAQVTKPGASPSHLHLSPWTAEIVKLAEAGTDDNVMLSFIDNSGTFSLGADQIIYLNDLGIPGRIVTAMLQHDNEVLSGMRPLTIVSQPPLDIDLTAMFGPARNPATLTPAAASPASAQSAPVAVDLVIAPKNEPSPAVQQNVAEARPIELQYAPTHETGPITSFWSSQSPETHGTLYPVREPYPVELLPPIVFVGGVERAPNTLVILGFSHDTR